MSFQLRQEQFPYDEVITEIFPNIKSCPGSYCGRIESDTVFEHCGENDTVFGPCGPCPWGETTNGSSICTPCTDSPTFYDWLYLGFMALLALVLNWFFIEYFAKQKKRAIILHISALLECSLAAIATLLLLDPIGSFQIRSCTVTGLSDWYTMLFNPKPGYTTTLHCTHEAVYPLYTIVFIYYAFDLVCLMFVRPLLATKLCTGFGKPSIYAALYFLPILTVTQAVGAGLIYYSFPYIIVIASLLTSALHFAKKEIESFKDLVKKPQNIVILLGHWLIHAYGIIAITQLEDLVLHASLLALVPVPAVFYLITVKFTDPTKIQTYSI
ncbi:JNK1/MAPK8-associated membrane protein-like [Saccoglossus kowalevskii]|uniref:JNK1/MAPK8-associated membrane protein-like n=1 Tax=Saccoglossus kowalevskii TaxID=10224 RepID=A0ABM0M6Z9_SACKO|nr:PREDICTED: JNK1/MAPK8-associated membrane protein-like [Saccoglossus kowalevskii]